MSGSESEPAGALVLMRIERDYVQDFRNTVMRYHSIINNFNGHVIGVTEAADVTVLERGVGWWVQGRHAIAMFEFPSMEQGERWFQSMPVVNQTDFLYGIDALLMPTRHPIPQDRRYVALTDALISSEESYVEGFETPASELLKKRNDVTAAVVATTDAQSLRSRDGWSPAYIVIHFFKDANAFATFQTSEECEKIRDKRARIAKVDEVCFELGPLMMPSPYANTEES